MDLYLDERDRAEGLHGSLSALSGFLQLQFCINVIYLRDNCSLEQHEPPLFLLT